MAGHAAESTLLRLWAGRLCQQQRTRFANCSWKSFKGDNRKGESLTDSPPRFMIPSPLTQTSMSELTKEYFDQVIRNLATKGDMTSQTQELKTYAREQTEELARMVADG